MKWYKKDSERLELEKEYKNKHVDSKNAYNLNYGFFDDGKFFYTYCLQYKSTELFVLCIYPFQYPYKRIEVCLCKKNEIHNKIKLYNQGFHNYEGGLCLFGHNPDEWESSYGIKEIIERVQQWFKKGQFDKENLLPYNYDMHNKIYILSNEIKEINAGIFEFKYIEFDDRIRVITQVDVQRKKIEFNNPLKKIFSNGVEGNGILLITNREKWNEYNYKKNTISDISKYYNRYGGSKQLFRMIQSNQINYPCPLIIVYKQNNYSGNVFELNTNKSIDISKYYLYTGKESLFNRVIEDEYKRLKRKKILIAGVGSIGSQICIQLLKSGIENFVLIDYDKLSVENIIKHELTLKNLHEYKTKALKNKMMEINPNVECSTIEKSVSEVSSIKQFREVIKKVDIIVSTIDEVNSKYILDGLALENGKSVIYVNSFYNANAGMVLFSNKKVACLNCLVEEIERMKDLLPEFNKGMEEKYKCGLNNYIASANYNSNIVNYGTKVILEFLTGKIHRDKKGYVYNCNFIGNKEMKTLGGEYFFHENIMIKNYIISGDKKCNLCGYE